MRSYIIGNTATRVETMDDEVMEFGIAHSRKYSRDHLWYQEKDDRLVIGISDFLAADIGEVLRIILPHAETEVDEEQNLFSIWTAEEKFTFPSPFAGEIAEVNGEVEINPELVNDSPYDFILSVPQRTHAIVSGHDPCSSFCLSISLSTTAFAAATAAVVGIDCGSKA